MKVSDIVTNKETLVPNSNLLTVPVYEWKNSIYDISVLRYRPCTTFYKE